ncbi:MAG: lysoplasmalogenase [Myxococcota bacterium]
MTLALLCALACGVALAGDTRGVGWAKVLGKLTAATAFVAWGVEVGLPTREPHGQALMLGLGLSWLGDALLLSKRKPVFLAGLVAFLFAHVAYTVAFVQLGVGWQGLAWAAPLLAGFAALVWRWLRPHVGALGTPVLAYVCVISVMNVTCAGMIANAPHRATLFAGALLFTVSDLFVARNRFVREDIKNRMIGLPLYFLAQFLIIQGAR